MSRNKIFIYFLFCIFCFACNSANNNKDNSKANATASTGGTLKMKLAAIVDNQVTKGNAFIFLLPEGWTQTSHIDWDMQNAQYPANGEVQVSNPGGTAVFHDYKTQYYTRANQTMYQTGLGPGKKYMGSKVMATMPNSTTEAANSTLAELGALPPGVKINETKVIPNKSTNPADIKAIKDNPQLQFISDKIIQKGTCSMKGENYTVIISSNVNATINQSLNIANWQVRPTVFMVKEDEKEKENTEILSTIYSSFRITPAYQQTYMQVVKTLTDQFYQGIRNIAAISAQISRNNDLLIQSMNQSYSQANKSSTSADKSSDAFSSYIRGTENYTDASGSYYELPNTYNTAWKSGNGEIILSNQAGYNPNADQSVSNQNWEEMKK